MNNKGFNKTLSANSSHFYFPAASNSKGQQVKSPQFKEQPSRSDFNEVVLLHNEAQKFEAYHGNQQFHQTIQSRG